MEDENLPSTEVNPLPQPVKNTSGQTLLEWQALEHEPREHSSDWYWLWGGVAFVSVIASIYFKDFLLAMIILLGAFSLFVHERRGPRMVHVKLTTKGILIDSNLYLYNSIRAFDIEEDYEPDQLVFESGRSIFPKIYLTLESANTPQVRQILSQYLQEEKLEKGFAENISSLFGF